MVPQCVSLPTRSGSRISTLYYHFHNKQDLLLRIMTRTMHDLITAVEQALVELDDPEERLRVAIRAHMLFHSSRRMEAFIADSELRALEPANRDEIVKLRDRYEHLFEEVLRDGAARGRFEVPDVKLGVYSLMGMCSGVSLWFEPGGRLSLSEIAALYARIFLNGIKSTASRKRIGRPSPQVSELSVVPAGRVETS